MKFGLKTPAKSANFCEFVPKNPAKFDFFFRNVSEALLRPCFILRLSYHVRPMKTLAKIRIWDLQDSVRWMLLYAVGLNHLTHLNMHFCHWHHLVYCSYGRLSSYYWCGVWHKNNWSFRSKDQASNMGYSRTREIQVWLSIALPNP